jgi:organic hydroperoxide reductase OsmC/OhrA
MLGTLIGALEVRQVKLEDDAVHCEAEGLHTIREGLPVLTEIRVRYRLRIPPGSRDTVERALARHAEKCPTAASLRGAVAVSWTAELEEAPGPLA